MVRGRAIAIAGQVFGFPNLNNARCSPYDIQINLRNPARGNRAQSKGQMQRAGWRGDVIHISRLSGDMKPGRIMGQGF
jgi:hypothetical protein